LNDRSRWDHRSSAAIKGVAQRLATFGLVVLAAGLLILGKADAVLMERIRSALTDAVTPVLHVLSGPAAAINRVVDESRRWLRVHEDNQALREERDRLLKWQAVALRLEAENAELKRLMHTVPAPEVGFVTARVVADSGGVFARSLVLAGGAAQGIANGHVALTGEGLIGRIAGVADRSARVLLLTDLNSRVPVIIEPSNARAILAGDNSTQPRLTYLQAGAAIAVGDRVVTAADADAFPKGIPIGVVSVVDGGEIRVQPHADPSRVDHVRIADFGLRGILGGSGPGGSGGTASARAAPRDAAP
jgi:rod shape-determining protein MreC